MKKIIFMSCLSACLLVTGQAVAQNKVVVVPLSSAKGVAGDNKQLQYNDNGTLAGADVYFNKDTGGVGIGNTSPNDKLSILNAIGNAGMYIGSTGSYIDMQSLGSTKISMISASDDGQNFSFIGGAKARGTYQAYTPVDAGDKLMAVVGKGQMSYSTDFDLPASPPVGIFFIASELWSASSQGSFINFATTENSGGGKAERMRIAHNGNVGINTANPLSKLAVSGLPTSPPDASGIGGVVCVTQDGNFWLDNDGTADCL